MTRKPITVLQAHLSRWSLGCGSDQCDNAGKICLYRGKIPCDVLFIGEAPGESENVLGRPFVGPAGQKLNDIVDRATSSVALCDRCGSTRFKSDRQEDDGDWTCRNNHLRSSGAGGRNVRMAFTNIVGCIPREDDGAKAGEPDLDQIAACKPRLEEFIRIAKPRLIVCVGNHARDAVMKRGYKHSVKLPEPEPKVIHITHPAAILRMNIAQRGLETQRCVVTIRSALEKLA